MDGRGLSDGWQGGWTTWAAGARGQRPQRTGLGGAGAAAAGLARRPAPPPLTGATESREERAGREAPLPPHRSGEPGPRRAEAGGERTRSHGGHRRGRRERGGGAAAARPWLRLPRGPLGPQRRQMSTTPRGRHSCSFTPPPPPPQQLITRHPLRNDSAAARGLLGNGVQSSVHAAGLCPTTNYNSQDSTLLKVSPRSPFPVPCAFGILEPPPLKTAG